jgi:hypothetical protein
MGYQIRFGEIDESTGRCNIGAHIYSDKKHIGKMRIFITDKKELEKFMAEMDKLFETPMPIITVAPIQKV